LQAVSVSSRLRYLPRGGPGYFIGALAPSFSTGGGADVRSSVEGPELAEKGRFLGSGGAKRPGEGKDRGAEGAIRRDGEMETKAKGPPTLSNASEVLSCPACGHPFRQKRRTQRACSRACYLALWHFEELKRTIEGGGAETLRQRIKELRKP
jgi:hypothetical protein